MNQIKIENRIYTYPSSYDEICSRQELTQILDILDLPITHNQAKSEALEVFLPTEKIFSQHPKFLNKEAKTNKIKRIKLFKYYLLKTVDWITKLDITRNILKFIIIGDQICYAPEERFANITLGQWANAHPQLFFYFHTKDIEHLHKLIAILYLPKGEEFQTQNIEEKATQVALLSEPIKQICLSYITRNWEELTIRFQDSVLKNEEGKGKRAKPQPPNWNRTIFSLSNGDITRLEEIMRQPLYQALLFLEDNRKQIERSTKPQ